MHDAPRVIILLNHSANGHTVSSLPPDMIGISLTCGPFRLANPARAQVEVPSEPEIQRRQPQPPACAFEHEL